MFKLMEGGSVRRLDNQRTELKGNTFTSPEKPTSKPLELKETPVFFFFSLFKENFSKHYHHHLATTSEIFFFLDSIQCKLFL